jgi:hypothetical protein
MGGRTYRLEVEGELGDVVRLAFRGMRVIYDHGNTALVGPVRDQAELNGLLQRCSDLGLTLLSINVIKREPAN